MPLLLDPSTTTVEHIVVDGDLSYTRQSSKQRSMRDETGAQRRRTVTWLLGVAALACVGFNALAQTDAYLRVVGGYSDLAMFPERSGKAILFALFTQSLLPLVSNSKALSPLPPFVEPCLHFCVGPPPSRVPP